MGSRLISATASATSTSTRDRWGAILRAPRLQTHGVGPVFGGCGVGALCYVYVIVDTTVGIVAEVTH